MTPPSKASGARAARLSCHVATPDRLARAMAAALGDEKGANWLEPCVGQGSLLRAISALGAEPARIRAIDLDRQPAEADGLASTIRGIDFLKWASYTSERFDRIIANPPYLALHRLPRWASAAATRLTAPDGTPVPLKANCWYAFVCGFLRLLQPRGSLALVLPAAWDFADYAAPVRMALPSLFGEVEVHRCAVPLFPGVVEGSIVVIAREFCGKGSVVRRLEHSSDEEVCTALLQEGDAESLPPSELCEELQGGAWRARRTALKNVMSLKIGGVTGDAKYFLMSETARKSRGLPVSCLRPVLTHAHHLTGACIDGVTWARLRRMDERVWLFRPSERHLKHKAVAAYLSLPRESGGCKRGALKVRKREPWFCTQLPLPAHGFLSGMSRLGPWIALSEMPMLSATNTLYVAQFLKTPLVETRAAWALSLLTTVAREGLARLGRRYPDGLIKHEPGDLAEVEVPLPPQRPGALSTYRRAVAQLLAGREAEASATADAWWD
jgi:adenine-specific DNA-methyltransferase